MKSINVYISIDIGSDVTKSAYAYHLNGEYYHDRLQINGMDFLSMAYYNPQDRSWKFGRDVYTAAKDNFRYLVLIRKLLDLFHSKDENHYYDERHLFRNFYFPPVKEEGSFEEMIKSQMCFETDYDTPRDVCQMFLTTYCEKIKAQADKILKSKHELDGYAIVYKYVLVYPSNASLEYIEELMYLVKVATGTTKEPKLISASKAVGAAAREYNLIDVSTAKNVLIFNVGSTETSVVRAKIDRDNIYTYRLKADTTKAADNTANEACNAPIKVGGHDFDMIINGILTKESNAIPPFGNQGEKMPGERGSFYAQFMTMQDIKAGKSFFSNGDYYEGIKDIGVEFGVRREMTVPVYIKKYQFEEISAPVFGKLWEFVKSKLLLNCTNDGNKIDMLLFAGGGSDTYGFETFIKRKLSEEFSTRKIEYIDFSPVDSSKGYEVAVCKSSYATAIGAVLFAVGKYKFKIVTTKAYGTAVDNQRKCSIIIKKGKEIPLKGKLIENEECLRTYTNVPANYNFSTQRHEYSDAFYKLNFDGAEGQTLSLSDINRAKYNIVEQRAIVVFDEKPSKNPVLNKGSNQYFNFLGSNGLSCLEGFIIDCEGRGIIVARKNTTDDSVRNISVHIPNENMEMD